MGFSDPDNLTPLRAHGHCALGRMALLIVSLILPTACGTTPVAAPTPSSVADTSTGSAPADGTDTSLASDNSLEAGASDTATSPTTDLDSTTATTEYVEAIDWCGDWEYTEDSDLTPLHEAVISKDAQLVRAELNAGADPNIQLRNGNAPIHLAAARSQVEIIEILLAAGADPNIQNHACETPMLNLDWRNLYASNFIRDAVELLLGAGADPNIQDIDGRTTLYSASASDVEQTRLLEILQLLLQADANPNINAIDMSRGCTNVPSDLNSCIDTPLIEVAYYGPIEVVHELLAADADPNLVGRYSTPLSKAASRIGRPSAVEIVEALLAAGADPDAPNIRGHAPLHEAVDSDDAHTETQVAIIEALLAADANPDIEDDRSWTPLHHAARHRHTEAVEVLLSAGADPNIKNEDGETALDLAESSDIRVLLLEAGGQRTR